MKQDIIHLFLIKKCNNKCPLCCNNLYDIDKIDVVKVDELKNAHTVCLTGGEPFIIKQLNTFAKSLRKQYPNIENIYVYTSGYFLYKYLKDGNELDALDGITMCPKSKMDWTAIDNVLAEFASKISVLKSNRFYTFVEETEDHSATMDMVKKNNIQHIERYWDEKFETPENEIFRRLPILFE